MGVKTTWFFPISPWDVFSPSQSLVSQSPFLILLITMSDCCISDVKPLVLPNESCPVFLPFLFPLLSLRCFSLFFKLKCQRPPHQLVLSHSLCSDVNQTLVTASVIIACNCTVCLIHRLRGFICMVISQISESKNLIPSVSCSVCVRKMKMRVSSLRVIMEIWLDGIYFPL